jgi:hypothetical protein
MTHKSRPGTFQEFKKFTLDVVKGKRRVDPSEPRIWVESSGLTDTGVREIQFHSLEAGVKLLSAKNRALLRLIAERHPKSVSELAMLAGRAEQNVLRTLHKFWPRSTRKRSRARLSARGSRTESPFRNRPARVKP